MTTHARFICNFFWISLVNVFGVAEPEPSRAPQSPIILRLRHSGTDFPSRAGTANEKMIPVTVAAAPAFAQFAFRELLHKGRVAVGACSGLLAGLLAGLLLVGL